MIFAPLLLSIPVFSLAIQSNQAHCVMDEGEGGSAQDYMKSSIILNDQTVNRGKHQLSELDINQKSEGSFAIDGIIRGDKRLIGFMQNYEDLGSPLPIENVLQPSSKDVIKKIKKRNLEHSIGSKKVKFRRGMAGNPNSQSLPLGKRGDNSDKQPKNWMRKLLDDIQDDKPSKKSKSP